MTSSSKQYEIRTNMKTFVYEVVDKTTGKVVFKSLEMMEACDALDDLEDGINPVRSDWEETPLKGFGDHVPAFIHKTWKLPPEEVEEEPAA